MIGGFRTGLEMNGHECVAFCEIDKYARQSYKAIYDTEGEEEWHDITQVSNDDFRSFRGRADVITGGFPCQAFSIAGKRRGFADTRGTLFFEIARAIKEIQPSYTLLENVKGLFSHDKGRTFGTIIQAMDELGYVVEWGLFNSKFWGVPQNRERVYILATRKDKFKEPLLFDLVKQQTEVTTRLIDVLEDEVDEKYYLSEEKTKKLTLDHDLGGKLNMYNYKELDRVHSVNKVSPTLNTMQGGDRQPKIAIPTLTPDRVNKRQNGRRFKEDGEPMFTLTSQDRHGVAIREATKKGHAVAEPGDSVNYAVPTSKTRRGRVGKQTANTLLTGEEQAVVLGGDNDDKNKERNTFEVLSILQKEIGEKEIAEWRSRILDTFQQEEILRQDVYEKGLDIEQDEKKFERNQQSHECEVKNTTFDEQERMREMSINKEFRCSSHGRGSIQQFARELTSIMQKLSHETSQEKVLFHLRETTQGIGLLQQTLYKIQEIWKSSPHKIQTIRIRKLTEKECWLLQGFTDEQFYKAKDSGVSNSQLYKQAGNSVTVNVIDAIARKLI